QNAFQTAVNNDAFSLWSQHGQDFETNLSALKQYLENIADIAASDPDNSKPDTQGDINDNVRYFLQHYHLHATELQTDIDRFASWLGVASTTCGPKYDAVDIYARYELAGRRYVTSRDSDQIRKFAAYVENLQALALAINEIGRGKPPESCGTDTTREEC